MLINGQPGDSIVASDRGLAYGDGLYRTLEVRHGQPLLWHWQWQRLAADCASLRLPCPDEALLLDEIARVAGELPRAVVKIVLTRGSGQRGYAMPTDTTPTRIVSAAAWAGYPAERAEQGVVVRWCATRLAIQPLLAGIKHLNRLENVFARSEWQDAAIAEGLMLDMDGTVVEGTMSNLFIVRGGELLTPPLDRCGVSGAMRACVLQLAANLGIAVREARLLPDDVLTADEAFICNSLAGIWPLRQLEQRQWQAWPLTRRLQQALAD
ncbi:aminodeoxychorismate lyase [Vogesella sp. LIG4]|uniref:aminodeoxychorismate lyase n=1 Tax=Vogesella sp. LIG4 TaxID=1192162 RepID=UPI000820017F|nr:aminodeoxychorismate lyase [Vogesella sp. LIG4]SCK19601.1 4-amino-4-deoxychorismate lyase [Vogesella sp. LIG4]